MIDAGLLTALGVVATPVLSLLGVLVGAIIGNRNGKRNAAAAGAQAQVSASKAVTADWESYTRSLREWAAGLVDRLDTVELRAGAAEKRLDTAESRAVLAEQRAVRAESLYKIAVGYLREVVQWASNLSHVDPMPDPPSELITDLTPTPPQKG